MADPESEPVLPKEDITSGKKSNFKHDRRKLPPITRDLHTAHHDPVRKTVY